MRSAGALYLPAGVALLGLVAYYRASALAGGSTAGRQYVRRGGRTVMACGMLLFLGGLLGGFAAVKVPPLVVPLLLGSGLLLMAYGRVLELKGSGERHPVAREAGAPSPPGRSPMSSPSSAPTSALLVAGLVVVPLRRGGTHLVDPERLLRWVVIASVLRGQPPIRSGSGACPSGRDCVPPLRD